MWIFHSHSMFKSSEMTQQSTIIAVIVFMWHDMLDLYTHVKQCANWFLFAHASTTIIYKFNGFTSSKWCDGGVNSHIFPECDLDTSICTIIRIGGWFSHAIDLAKHLLLMRDVHQFFCFLFMLAYCLRMHCRPHHTYSCWFFFYRYYINSA